MERESGEEITGKLVFTQKLVDSLNVYVGSLPVSCRKFRLESPFSPIFEWFPVPCAM